MNLTPIRPYFKFIQKTLNKNIKNPDDAKDVFQEMMIYLHLKKEAEIKHPKTYLHKLCCWYAIKKKSSDKTEDLEDRVLIGPKVVFNSDSGWNGYEIDDGLMTRLGTIPGTLYEPLALQVFDNMSIHQIAVKLGLNENTVKTNIRRAKIFLRGPKQT